MTQFIEQCEARFAFECPKHWSALTKTDQTNVRYCNACSEHVYLCTNADEIAENKKKRHCVAIESSTLDFGIQATSATEANEIEPFITMGILTGDGLQRETERITQKLRVLIASNDLPNGSRAELQDLLDRIESTDSTNESRFEQLLRDSKHVPPCPHCGKPLRTSLANQCFECGADLH